MGILESEDDNDDVDDGKSGLNGTAGRAARFSRSVSQWTGLSISSRLVSLSLSPSLWGRDPPGLWVELSALHLNNRCGGSDWASCMLQDH